MVVFNSYFVGLAIAPEDPRVREMVRWLLYNREGNHYDSTRSTAVVAFALAVR